MPFILFHTIFTAPLSLRQSLRRRQVWAAWHNKAHPPVFLPITCTASFSTSHTSLLPSLLPPTHSCTSPITLCFLPASSPAHLPLLMLLQHPYCVRLHRHPVSLPPSCFLFYFFFFHILLAPPLSTLHPTFQLTSCFMLLLLISIFLPSPLCVLLSLYSVLPPASLVLLSHLTSVSSPFRVLLSLFLYVPTCLSSARPPALRLVPLVFAPPSSSRPLSLHLPGGRRVY